MRGLPHAHCCLFRHNSLSLTPMFTLDEVLEGTVGQLSGAHAAVLPHSYGFSSVAIDSRKCSEGTLFVALPGEHVDGHSFVPDAAAHGARAAIVRRDWPAPANLPENMLLVRVDDPLTSLQQFAGWWRTRHNVRAVAITGSVGKTTTKEAIAAVLATQFRTLKSEGNFNNEIGLPLTLLRLEAEHEAMVLEMGAGYALGELTLLCELARPDIAVVTNVQPVHLERMGIIERIALNKSEIVRALPPAGTAVLNRDDPRVFAMREVSPARVLTYGLDPEADLQATDIEGLGLEGVRFTIHLHPTGEQYPVKLSLLGRHSVYTVLAAAGAAYAAGMQFSDIIVALESLSLQVRLVVVPGAGSSTIIDDTYNASPLSVIAALNLLSEMEGRHIAVLGDMLELGSHEQEGHYEVGRCAATSADYLVAVGQLGRLIGEEALRAGMQPECVYFAGNNSAVIDYLKPRLKAGDYVLVKGSRGLYMEEIVQGLKA